MSLATDLARAEEREILRKKVEALRDDANAEREALLDADAELKDYYTEAGRGQAFAEVLDLLDDSELRKEE